MGVVGDIGIGIDEISRFFKVISVKNRYESVTYRVLGIGIGWMNGFISKHHKLYNFFSELTTVHNVLIC